VIACDDRVGSQIVSSQGAQYVVQDHRFSLGNQILHGMSCLLVKSKMCNYFLYKKNTKYSLALGRACSLNGSNKKLLQNAGEDGGHFEDWRENKQTCCS
jgi:hypothetical protein